jgi:hypothetical protein
MSGAASPGSPPGLRKASPLKWVLLGVGFLLFCIMAFFAVGTYFVYRTVRNAGFDPELMRRNPGLALSRMAIAKDPDAEVVATDERAGTVTIRERGTGKTMTLKFDPDKKRLVVVEQK